MVDPKFSPDGSMVVYWQALVMSPACGGDNPLPCPKSTVPYGRAERLMLATFTDCQPLHLPPVEPASDDVSWGTPYEAGAFPETHYYPTEGNYTLNGAACGYAQVTLIENSDKTTISSVAIAYYDYSDDDDSFLNGFENATSTHPSITVIGVDYFANLRRTGPSDSTKTTSDDGFHIRMDIMRNIFEANGTLVTTVNGKAYHQPANGT